MASFTAFLHCTWKPRAEEKPEEVRETSFIRANTSLVRSKKLYAISASLDVVLGPAQSQPQEVF
jgi:hypothetical protein